jgi:hypothetical protein
MTHGLNPVLASMTARRAYWQAHGLNGNRADAQRAADLAYNAAVLDGPASFRRAYYPLRPVEEMDGEKAS